MESDNVLMRRYARKIYLSWMISAKTIMWRNKKAVTVLRVCLSFMITQRSEWGGGGGSSNCRLSVKVPLLCRKSVKNFLPLSVVGKSQLINENACQLLMSVMYFTQFHDFDPYKTCWTCNNASFDWTSTPLTPVCLIYVTWSFISPLIDWLFISPLASRTFALGVDKTRNMEHPGTSRNMKKLKYFLWKIIH